MMFMFYVVGVWSSELSYVLHVTQLQMMKETYTHLNVLINYSRASSKVPIMHRKVPELVVLLSEDSSSSVSQSVAQVRWRKNGIRMVIYVLPFVATTVEVRPPHFNCTVIRFELCEVEWRILWVLTVELGGFSSSALLPPLHCSHLFARILHVEWRNILLLIVWI